MSLTENGNGIYSRDNYSGHNSEKDEMIYKLEQMMKSEKDRMMYIDAIEALKRN